MKEELPENWVEVQFIDILSKLENGSRPKGGVQGILHGIPSLGGEHLSYDGGFKFETLKYVPESFASKMNRGLIKHQDILIVKDGATTGKTSIVKEDFPFDRAYVNEHVFLCRIYSSVSPKYVYYFLRSKRGQKRLLDNFTGSAQGGINQKFASNTLIPLAPLAEQKRIVAKLDEAFQHLETLKVKLDRIPQLLKKFRETVLTHAVTGKLTEEWRKNNGNFQWQTILLENIADVVDPHPSHRTPPEVVDGVPFVSIKDVSDGVVNLSSARKVSSTILDEHINRYNIEEGDFIFGKIGTLGKPVLLPVFDKRCYALSANIILIQPRFDSISKYIYFYMSSSVIKKLLTEGTNSTSQPAFGIKKVRNFPIQLPSKEEQFKIVERIDDLYLKAKLIEKHLIALNESIQILPQSLLAKAFKGELVPQDENDEPASELLERIKEAKALTKRVAKLQEEFAF